MEDKDLENLYCPLHRDVVLFRVPAPGKYLHMIVPPRPAECPKCKKSYQQYECISEWMRDIEVADEN